VTIVFKRSVFFYLIALAFLLAVQAQAQGTGQADVAIVALVPGCGNDVIESGEECDGVTLGSATCNSRGFTSGALSCTASCFFNTTACVYTPPVLSGGGGGASTKGARVVLSGRAYPASKVTILKDAQVVATTVADDTAHFQVHISGLSAGTYFFSLYSEDDKGIRSALLTFPVAVTKGILAKIDSIFVAPTITADKVAVKKGNPVILFGQSAPISDITIEVNSPQQLFFKTKSSSDGAYLYTLDSSVLDFGQHHAQSRSAAELAISSQSAAYEFEVGSQDVYSKTSPSCSTKADLNADCRVNLVDFSIVAFWYNRPLSPAFLVRETDHLNGDGKINLVDFSIMAFNWTG
jgi:hypothetical protein